MSEDKPKDSFVLLQDKNVSGDISILAWCPTMDLLAIATSESHIWIHRFLETWQRLLTISCDGSAVSALVWRPDGKVLAAGHDDGSITLYSVENGELLHTSHRHSCCITKLYWSQLPQDVMQVESEYIDRSSLMLPVDLCHDDTTANFKKTLHTTGRTNNAPPSLDVLVSCDQSGRICLHAFGSFFVGSVSVGQDMGSNSNAALNIYHLSMTSDLRVSLFKPFQLLTAMVNTGADTYIVTFDVSKLWERKREIRTIANQVGSVNALLDYVQWTIKEMNEKWNEGITPFTGKLEVLEKMLEDGGSTATIQQELLGLLACGTGSPPLQQFLLNTLPETAMRRLAKAVDTMCVGMQQVLLNTLKPCADTLLFRTSELHSLSKWHERFDDMGVREESFAALLTAAKNLAVKSEMFLNTVCTAKSNFDSFFIWILKAQRKLSNEPPVARKDEQKAPLDELRVARFLKNGLMTDAVAKQLGTLEQQTENGQLSGDYYVLRNKCEEIFGEPAKTLSSVFMPQRIIPVASNGDGSDNYLYATFCQAPEANKKSTLFCQHLAILDKEAQDDALAVWIIRITSPTVSNNNYIWEAACLYIQHKEDTQPVDIRFYNNEFIAVLSEQRSEGTNKLNALLEMYSYEDLKYIPLEASKKGDNIINALKDLFSPSEVSSPAKQRLLTKLPHTQPLSLVVNGARGVGCVFVAPRRVVLYDMEDDEEDEDEDEGDNDDENKENEADEAEAEMKGEDEDKERDVGGDENDSGEDMEEA